MSQELSEFEHYEKAVEYAKAYNLIGDGKDIACSAFAEGWQSCKSKMQEEIDVDHHCNKIQFESLKEKCKLLTKAVEAAQSFLLRIEIEADEDSCMGMAFVTNRVGEDEYYMVINRNTKVLSDVPDSSTPLADALIEAGCL